MNIFLWVLQILLAVMFLPSGANKVMKAKDIQSKDDWAETFSPSTIQIIGILEMFGAIGIIFPWALNIYPILTPLAAIGLALTMLSAAALQIKRKDFKVAIVCFIIMFLALVVAWGRF